MPEGISYGFIRFIGGNADILRNTLSGLRFCLLIYVLVNLLRKIRAFASCLYLRVLTVDIFARQSEAHIRHSFEE